MDQFKNNLKLFLNMPFYPTTPLWGRYVLKIKAPVCEGHVPEAALCVVAET